MEELCKCGNPGSINEHPCPLRIELQDDHNTLCNCCSECCKECLDNV